MWLLRLQYTKKKTTHKVMPEEQNKTSVLSEEKNFQGHDASSNKINYVDIFRCTDCAQTRYQL